MKMVPSIGNVKIVEYGIQTEDSDWRAHVCVNAGKVYVFPTKLAVQFIRKGNYRLVAVNTRIGGREILTAHGHLIPALSLPRVVPVSARSIIDRAHFNDEDSTTIKGEKAVDVVQTLLRIGWFPLPWDTSIVEDIGMQRGGLDIVVSGSHKIQVKCDYEGGEPVKSSPRVTGNLFLQIDECNPLRAK